MQDESKTKAQLINELAELRQRVAELEAAEAERVRVEEALRRNELRFRSLIEQTTDAVFCYEPDPPIPTDLPIEEQVKLLYDCVLVECNDVCARSYAATRAEEVIGKRLTDLFGTSPGSLDELFAALIQGGYRIVDGEGVEVLEDGTKRYYLNNGHGVVEDGMLLRVWGTFRDITDRKRAEEALRESEARFRSIYSQSPIAIELYDSEGLLIDVNPACLDLFGVADVEAVKGFKLFGDPNVPEDAMQWLLAGEAVKYESEFDFELVKEMDLYETTKSGRCFIDCFITPWIVGAGAPSGFLVHVRDITDRVRAEKEREKLIAELQEALDNIKTLEGLIPICANCKKIRDDEGFWQDVAVYVRDHSEAEFSHGLCPDCMKELYSDFL